MLTAEHIRAHNHCGCANCEAAYLAAIEEDNMVAELRKELNDADLDIVASFDTGEPIRAGRIIA